jgi:hypothetical protein
MYEYLESEGIEYAIRPRESDTPGGDCSLTQAAGRKAGALPAAVL